MSERLKQFLDDVLEGRNKSFEEILNNDRSLQRRYRTMMLNLELSELTLDCCLKEIAESLFKESGNNGSVISLLMLAKVLDNFHTAHSTWYRRTLLIDILCDIFEANAHIFHKIKPEWASFVDISLYLFTFFVIFVILYQQ